MRVCVMQPYFMPYAGYFRLFAGADLFVAFDCVQFPRRGWVHRNRLATAGGAPDWLTLPLQKSDRDTTRICDLRFRDRAQQEWHESLRRFPAAQALAARGDALAARVLQLGSCPVDYIVAGMLEVAQLLDVERPLIRSSSLDIDPALRGQARILEILRHVGATEYLNAPGGRELYDSCAFRRAGIRLLFLSHYRGGFASVLERLALEPVAGVRAELHGNLEFEEAADAGPGAPSSSLSARERDWPAPSFGTGPLH
jgi:hypothetical protein